MSRNKNAKSRPPASQTRPAAAPAEPEPERELRETLAEARTATANLVKGADDQRAQLTELLKRFMSVERRLLQPEKDVKALLEGVADALDLLVRWEDDEAAAGGPHLARIQALARGLERTVATTSEAALIGRVGETADPATHKLKGVEDRPGVAEFTVLNVWEHGIRYRGELLRTAVVTTASGKGVSE
jgi:molecular chaperone GrpE (heat shock protein)